MGKYGVRSWQQRTSSSPETMPVESSVRCAALERGLVDFCTRDERGSEAAGTWSVATKRSQSTDRFAADCGLFAVGQTCAPRFTLVMYLRLRSDCSSMATDRRHESACSRRPVEIHFDVVACSRVIRRRERVRPKGPPREGRHDVHEDDCPDRSGTYNCADVQQLSRCAASRGSSRHPFVRRDEVR